MQATGFRGIWRDDQDARDVYAESAAILRITPAAVAVPADADDAQRLVRWASESRTPIVARGSGSSMSGACLSESVVVDLSALKGGPVVDGLRQVARTGPATTRAGLDHAARGFGLRFPVDPSSGAFCTIGGMVATNAAGARTMKYGSTRSWVTALDCVFSDGSRAWVRRGAPLDTSAPALARFAAQASELQRRSRGIQPPAVRKNASGYGISEFGRSGELIDLLVGSEGTLALFVDVEVALAEAPTETASLLVCWNSLAGAVHGATLAREAGASACELLDRTFVRIVAEAGHRSLAFAADVEAVLLIELEYVRHASDSAPSTDDEASGVLSDRAAALERAMLAAGATQVLVGVEPESEETLWAVRHAASPILARLDPAIASMQVIEDGVVPPARLGEYVLGVRRALDRAGIRGVIFGHAGDANVHVNALVDVRDTDWNARLIQLFDEVTELTAHLGGTSSGEHGDGRLRTPTLSRFWSPEALDLFSEIKQGFDPGAILNPGVKIRAHATSVWNAIKYDHSLPPVSARVHQVLERVARERAYDRSRLEMLDEAV